MSRSPGLTCDRCFVNVAMSMSLASAETVERLSIRSAANEAHTTDRPLAALIEAMRNERSALDRIAVKADGRVLFIRIGEIDWIEADDDLVRIHAGKAVHA